MLNLFSNKRVDEPEEKLFFTTDIHNHILPGIDDGASRVSRAVELVKALKRWGIEHAIATPHVTEDTFENTLETITDAMAQLRGAIEAEGIEMSISHSAEFRIDEFSLKQIESGRIVPMADNHLLVENSYVQEPWNLDQTLFQLKLQGFNLIMAHPERYIYYHDNKRRYQQLHGVGIAFQINALSLAGHYGKRVKQIAEWLIEQEMVDYVGTDIHHRAHVESIDRYLGSKDFKRHREQLEGRLLNDTLRP